MSLPEPPVAPRRPTRRERFGILWTDDYAWLRDPDYPQVTDPDIRAYLDAENRHTDAFLAPYRDLVDALHAELKGRIKEDDGSVPVRDGAFTYHWRFAPGDQYRTWLRRHQDAAEPEIILDENVEAADKSYFRSGTVEVSPDATLLAWSADEDGSERYRIHVKDLASGDLLPDLVANASGAIKWVEGEPAFLWVELNDKLRPYRVRLHRLGTEAGGDPILYEEGDPAFFVSIGKTRSRRYLVIATGTHVTNELRLLDAARPERQALLLAPRRDNHRYSLDHAAGDIFILTNDRHENYRLVKASADWPCEEAWSEVIAGSDAHYLLAISCFQDFMVLTDRAGGLSRLRIRSYDGEDRVTAFDEPVYTVHLGDNREFATRCVRLGYSSMVTPASVIELDVASGERRVLKVQEVPSGYDPSRYRTQRLLAHAKDGAEIPITLVHRDDTPPEGGGPLLLYGYGAYGIGLEPAFAPSRLSLLDRGFVFAFAHVRGGDEMGFAWYRNGKLGAKAKSFKDFITCAEYLVRTGWTRTGEIAIRGGSAGGMLMGAVLNQRPDLFRCAVLEVPFVDVLNTMLDASLPLTPIEWPEWGDPVHDPDAFARILSYCPYENIREQAYPPMLVTAGLSDPRVTYWEPAKYVARLRACRTDDNLLLLKTNMEAGHFGRSGRWDALRDLAEQYVFLLHSFGMVDREKARTTAG